MDKQSMYLLGFFLTLLGFPISQDNDPSLFLSFGNIVALSAKTTLDGWWGHVACTYAYLPIEGGLKA